MSSLPTRGISTLVILSLLSIILMEVEGLTQSERQAVLEKHNEFRAGVSPAASNMKKMKWNFDLEKMAQIWADKCEFKHGDPECDNKPFSYNPGQNLWMGSRLGDVTSPVGSWHSEVSSYTYSTHSCSGVCGHYTQVVWANSKEVGCAKSSNCDGKVIFVCNYGPPGNYVGAKPYSSGTGCSDCAADHGSCEGGKLCTTSDASSDYDIPSSPPASTMTCEGDGDGVAVPQLSTMLVIVSAILNMAILRVI